MACKRPVVCTDIGGVQDFAFNENTALLVPPRDSEAMARAILRLIREPQLRQRLASNAFDHITTFSWDASAARLEHIIVEGLQNPFIVQYRFVDKLFHVIDGVIFHFLTIIYDVAIFLLRFLYLSFFYRWV